MSPTPDIANQYARMQIATSAGPKIVCMLHQRCVTLIQQSLSSTAPSRPVLDKAQNILAQLERALNVNDDLSQSLFYLYDFCYCSLEKTDPGSHQFVSRIMATLRDTFDQLFAPNRQEAKI